MVLVIGVQGPTFLSLNSTVFVSFSYLLRDKSWLLNAGKNGGLLKG